MKTAVRIFLSTAEELPTVLISKVQHPLPIPVGCLKSAWNNIPAICWSSTNLRVAA